VTKGDSIGGMFSARVCRFLRATLAELVSWAIVAIAAWGVLDSLVSWLGRPW
jgi:hypothetical protein